MTNDGLRDAVAITVLHVIVAFETSIFGGAAANAKEPMKMPLTKTAAPLTTEIPRINSPPGGVCATHPLFFEF